MRVLRILVLYISYIKYTYSRYPSLELVVGCPAVEGLLVMLGPRLEPDKQV
jgi:hypothetical protein